MLYQFNIMRMAHPKHSEVMQSFFSQVDAVNRLAIESNGFIWRPTDDSDPVIQSRLGTDVLVNLSAWESIDTLYGFVFNPRHRAVMVSKDRWFEDTGKANSVLWSEDTLTLANPEWSEAIDRLESLWRLGPTEYAFDFAWALQNDLTRQPAWDVFSTDS